MRGTGTNRSSQLKYANDGYKVCCLTNVVIVLLVLGLHAAAAAYAMGIRLGYRVSPMLHALVRFCLNCPGNCSGIHDKVRHYLLYKAPGAANTLSNHPTYRTNSFDAPQKDHAWPLNTI